MRFFSPVAIGFGPAIMVAAIGLVVNLASAWVLRDEPHHHGHDHDHHHAQDHHDQEHASGRDNNLRAAYLHVLADALTSVLAIVALVAGSMLGWTWTDPAMGLVGALVIAHWSFGLIRDAGRVLVDYVPEQEDLPDEIREAVETGADRIIDLHVWQVGPGHHAAIVAVSSTAPATPSVYKARLEHIHELSHVTVEVQPAA